ncbi:unnamed protein product [Ambrosiozyma monospora]|uniref:Unnamed protein product n=1 Tax=Ambrosiozyma monospora TaxID=43982 RepID=A0A9W6Z0H1_AMBMO|nr:unnamed protein product [Ambrosiozyma monospora]
MIGASNKLNPLDSSSSTTTVTGGITNKIITDVITPLVDSAFYSYLSRCNLKTYTVRLTLVVAELYLLLGQSSAFAKLSRSALKPESFYVESMKLFEKLIDSKLLESTSNAKLIERVAYIYYFHDQPPSIKDTQPLPKIQREDYYEQQNPDKLKNPGIACFGMAKRRKSILWLLLACKELDLTLRPTQVKLLINCIERDLHDGEEAEAEANFDGDGSSESRAKMHNRFNWLYRENSMLHRMKLELYGE